MTAQWKFETMAGTVMSESAHGGDQEDVFRDLLDLQNTIQEQKRTLAEWLKENNQASLQAKERVKTRLLPVFWQIVHDTTVSTIVGENAHTISSGPAIPGIAPTTPSSPTKSQHKQAGNASSSSTKRNAGLHSANSSARSQSGRSSNRRQRPARGGDGQCATANSTQTPHGCQRRQTTASHSAGSFSSVQSTAQGQHPTYNTSSLDDFPSLGVSSAPTPRISQPKVDSDSSGKRRRIKPTAVPPGRDNPASPDASHRTAKPASTAEDSTRQSHPAFSSGHEESSPGHLSTLESTGPPGDSKSNQEISHPANHGQRLFTEQTCIEHTVHSGPVPATSLSLLEDKLGGVPVQLQKPVSGSSVHCANLIRPGASDSVDELAGLVRKRLLFGDEVTEVATSADVTENTPTCPEDSVRSSRPAHVLLCSMASLYVACIEGGLAVNVFTEIHLLVHLLSAKSFAAIPSSASPSESQVKERFFQALSSASGHAVFAASCLQQLSQYLQLLDDNSRRLLTCHPKILQYAPELVKSLSKAGDHSKQGLSFSQQRAVPFQEDRDGVAFFPSQKAYHGFKRQRSTFCSLLRQWEEAEGDGRSLVVELTMGDRIRELLDTQLTNLIHFVRYFVLQLLQNSQTENSVLLDGITEEDASVLRKADADKLQRLQRKLVESSYTHGSCPQPSFPGNQEFFRQFIEVAQASSPFFFHLQAYLSDKVVELNCKDVTVLSSQTSPQGAIFQVVQQLIVLGKFLGFVISLPSGRLESVPQTLEPTWMKFQTWWPTPPLCFEDIIEQSFEGGRLCLTLPWVVHALASLGPLSLHATAFKPTWNLLFAVKRKLHVTPSCPAKSFLLMLLGWLFELLCVSLPSPPTLADDSDVSLDLSICNGDDSVLAHMVNSSFVASVCPFVNEIGRTLSTSASEFMGPSSSRRRIKSVCSVVRKPEVDAQDLLGENFMMFQPPAAQQVVNVVVERFVSRAKKEVSAHTLPAILAKYRDEVSSIVYQDSEVLTLDVSSLEARCLIRQLSARLQAEFVQSAGIVFDRFSQGDCFQAVSLLLDGEVPASVVGSARALAGRRIRLQLVQWQDATFTEMAQTTIRALLDKARHVAVSTVGPALKELENGDVRDPSWSLRPVDDALKVLDRRIEAGAYTAVLNVIPHLTLVENVIETHRVLQAFLDSHASSQKVSSELKILEVLKDKRLSAISLHSCLFALACARHHASDCVHGCTPVTESDHLSFAKVCDTLARVRSSLLLLWSCLKEHLNIAVPPPELRPRDSAQALQTLKACYLDFCC